MPIEIEHNQKVSLVVRADIEGSICRSRTTRLGKPSPGSFPNSQIVSHAMRPKDAASLILVRRADDGPRVLMGRREPRHAFMPDVFVFPGGAVDRGDGYVTSSSELRAEVLKALVRDCTAHRARAIALAGIRETFEETGLLFGSPAPGARPSRSSLMKSSSDGWRGFLETGLVPELAPLEYVAHAVTPPGPPRRFHARFFIADAANASGELMGNGELLDLGWYPLGDAFALPIAGVTRLVLKEVVLALDGAAAGDRIPLFTRRRGTRIIIYE